MSAAVFVRSAVLCLSCVSALAASQPLNALSGKPIAPDAAVKVQIGSPNLLAAKIALDRTIDPSITPAETEAQVAKLIAAARIFAGPHPSVGAQFDAVRKVLYRPGPWNGNRAFAYDQGDPLGTDVHHKLLSYYLVTHRGNCVTMPTLFMIVGRGIGLHLTLTTAPLHELVRFTHPGLPVLDIEATSGGGFARTEWLRQVDPMSDRSIESGLYLRTHSDRETVAEMANMVLEYLIDTGRNEEAVKVADVILSADPKDGFTMVKKGTAIAAIIKAEFEHKYPTPAQIPPNLRGRYEELAAANQKAFADAEALGWEASQ